MAHYPTSATGLAYITYPAGPTAQALQITGGTSNTKGSYGELTSSSAFECNSVRLAVTESTAIAQRILIDLATGPGGSETVVVPNIVAANPSGGAARHAGQVFELPLTVPSGTRIAARHQSSQGAQNLFVALTLIAAGDTPGVSAFTAYGADTSTSGGVSVDPGGSANTKGSYAEVTSSTTAVVQFLMLCLTCGGNSNPSASQWAVDLATGPGGSETVLIPDLRTNGSAGDAPRLRAYSLLTYIPASTRIAVRASCDITDATDRVLQVGLIATTAPPEDPDPPVTASIQVIPRMMSSLGSGSGGVGLKTSTTTTAGFPGFTRCVWPCDGVFQNLVTRLSAPPGGTATRTFALEVNGVTTDLECVHGAASVEVADSTHTVPVSAGDLVRLVGNTTGLPALAHCAWTIEFAATNDGESGYSTNLGTAASGFLDPFTGEVNGTRTVVEKRVPCDGTFTAAFAADTFVGVGSGDSLDFYVYLNGVRQDGTGGTVDTKVTLNDVAANTPVSTTFSLPVVRGDRISVELEASGGYPPTWSTYALRFLADVPGESILAGGGSGTPTATGTSYSRLNEPSILAWSTSASFLCELRCGVTPFGLKDLLLDVDEDPGDTATRDFAVLRNWALPTDGPAGTISTGSLEIDDTNSVAFGNGDSFTFRHIPSNTPTVTGDEWWSLVLYIGDAPDPEEPEPRDPPGPGGEVGEGIEPAAAEVPTGVSRIFVTFTTDETSPTDGFAISETRLRDPDTWHFGEKAPLLTGISEIERSLSDTVQGVRCQIQAADDGTFRAWAASSAVVGTQVDIYRVSDTVRYALGEPYRLFAGRIHSYRFNGRYFECEVRDVLSEHLITYGDSARIPPGRLTLEQFPGMTSDYDGRAIPLVLGHLDDEGEIAEGDSEVIQFSSGAVPPLIVAPSLNFSTAWGGSDIDVIPSIISHGAIAANGVWEGYYNTPTVAYRRFLIPDSAWGVVVWAPGMPGWEMTGLATDYADYPLPSSASTHRYTPFFVHADFPPYSQAFRDGKVTVGFNLYGLTENADGSGRYLSDAPRIYQWLVNTFLFNEWRTGDYPAIPVLASGYSIINTPSVETATTRLRTFGAGSPSGSPDEDSYEVGFVLGYDGQQVTLRHVLDQLCQGVLMEQGIDRHGRLMLDVEDPEAAATVSLSDLHDIEEGRFEVWLDRESYRNRVEYVHGRRYLPASAPVAAPAEGEPLPNRVITQYSDWTSGLRTEEHALALAANGGRKVTRFFENWVVRNRAVAGSVASRLLERAVGPNLDGPLLFRLTTSWQGFVELGTVIEIDHVDGIGASGYEGQRGRVLKVIVDPLNDRVTLEGRLLFGEVPDEGSPSEEPPDPIDPDPV